jgi:hypothetical protein
MSPDEPPSTGGAAGTGTPVDVAEGGRPPLSGPQAMGAGGTPSGPVAQSCSISVTASSVSEVIPTVGIVEWSTELEQVESAVIEFGLDTTYGQNAPVDLAEPNFRTLILGMKADREYHYRVVANGAATTCQSEDLVLQTGTPPNSLLGKYEITTPLPDEVADGFLLTSFFNGGGGPVFILDKERDLVWWYTSKGDDVFRARTSYDGKSMWIRNTANEDVGRVYRVSMDGLDEAVWELPRTTHDLAVIPDGNVGLIARADNGCDEILELDPETNELTTIANLEAAYGSTNCHLNALAYYAPDDAFIVSDYIASSYIKVSRSGEVLWVLNGANSDFTGSSWDKQHNLHMLSRERILLFSNGGSGQPPTLFEFVLDEQAGTASEVWRFENGPSSNIAGGDVQRLPNGNTLGTYSVAGVILEVNLAGQVVQELAGALGTPFAHSVHQPSLYGPPPRIHDFEAL